MTWKLTIQDVVDHLMGYAYELMTLWSLVKDHSQSDNLGAKLLITLSMGCKLNNIESKPF